MKKATLYKRVKYARLPDVVPPAYRQAVVEDLRPEGIYTVMLFAHAERDVVTSSELKRALRRLPPLATDGILLVGTVFTLEARVLAGIQGMRIVSMRNSVWTDESARNRQL